MMALRNFTDEEEAESKAAWRRYHFDQHIFDEIDTEHKAYWLGFLYADGYAEKKGLRIGLARKDLDQLYKFREFMKSDHKIYFRPNRCDIGIWSDSLSKRMWEIGIVPRRGKFHLTKASIPLNLRRHFIRGYIDGDGCLAKDERIIILGQMDILTWIMDIFHNELEINRTKYRKRRGTYEISFGGREQAWRIIGYLYIDTSIFMERKFNKTRNWKFPNRRPKSSKYVGVSLFKRTGRWSAHVKHKGKTNHIGYFANEDDAARARDKLALELQGSEAKLNFPD